MRHGEEPGGGGGRVGVVSRVGVKAVRRLKQFQVVQIKEGRGKKLMHTRKGGSYKKVGNNNFQFPFVQMRFQQA